MTISLRLEFKNKLWVARNESFLMSNLNNIKRNWIILCVGGELGFMFKHTGLHLLLLTSILLSAKYAS